MTEQDWKRIVMVGSFAAAAVLVFTGKRNAAFAVAGVGLATLASEHPEKLQKVWDVAPDYVEKGSRLVSEVGDLVEKIAEKGTKLKGMSDSLRGRTGTSDYLT